ncbi:hypothetical protein ACW9I8_06030 [Pseudomonas reactans]|uniref:Uncharacterized protein n=2 Tax=Pseudomonas TaxID=286 RepID=A0ABX2QN47_9PSED|nr:MULTISPECIES: hypothetical protein [Pseudomonas]KGE66872.1 hypothetical protein K814_0116510 [Pseudomonas fluorescens LMG 5329]NWA45760.1 hypothetical protein [Pseudomonas reactans]NWC50555.1 hypothetical protein [Pseudomonas tolaasii]NWC75630.1 hypothetical protein [Pseudomonas sp. P7759]NWC88172.1 hypothetical protein [Pseudomonas reactans]
MFLINLSEAFLPDEEYGSVDHTVRPAKPWMARKQLMGRASCALKTEKPASTLVEMLSNLFFENTDAFRRTFDFATFCGKLIEVLRE